MLLCFMKCYNVQSFKWFCWIISKIYLYFPHQAVSASSVNPVIYTFATLTGHCIRTFGPAYSVSLSRVISRLYHGYVAVVLRLLGLWLCCGCHNYVAVISRLCRGYVRVKLRLYRSCVAVMVRLYVYTILLAIKPLCFLLGYNGKWSSEGKERL